MNGETTFLLSLAGISNANTGTEYTKLYIETDGIARPLSAFAECALDTSVTDLETFSAENVWFREPSVCEFCEYVSLP